MQGWLNSQSVSPPYNRLKKKQLMMVSVNMEKAFDKIQHLYMIKTLR